MSHRTDCDCDNCVRRKYPEAMNRIAVLESICRQVLSDLNGSGQGGNIPQCSGQTWKELRIAMGGGDLSD